MSNDQIRIRDMIPEILEGLRALGFSEQSIWNNHHRLFRSICIFFEKRNKEYYDDKTLEEYAQQIQERFDNGEIARGCKNEHLKAVERFADYYHTGKVVWNVRKKGTKFVLCADNECIVQDFIAQTSYTDNSKGDALWAIRKYLCFIEGKNYPSLKSISFLDVQDFLVHCSSHMKGSGIRNLRGYIHKFHLFLNERKICSLCSKKILEIKIVRENHISLYLTENEIERILEQINRATSLGKRNYAIIILAMQTGIRAHDIANLKLSDIDWRNGEINLLQHKTMTQARLPLTAIAGEAVKEYILNGRPDSESEYLFLRANSPHQKMFNGIAIQNMFNDYQKKAGIVRSSRDGKGFHSIRRLIGYNMATNGVPVTTITQVLGHIGSEAVNQYIALDTEHLKECALSFNGIEIEGGELL